MKRIQHHIIAGFTLCLLALLSVRPGYAITYSAGLENSQWHVEGSELECRLWQPVPGFGDGVFSKRAGYGLSFYLKPGNSSLAPGKARLAAEGPHWKPASQVQLIGEAEVTDAPIPLQVARPYAQMMLANLNQGLMPTISTQSDIAAGYPQVKVVVSTVNFPKAYAEYQHCLSGLLPVNYKQIAKSAIFYSPGKTKLSPEVREYLDLIIRYVKADKRIRRVVIDGHTDSSGDKQINFKVSRLRSDIVTAYFKKAGVSSKLLLSRYHGDKYPSMANDNDDNRARNRRVTIRLDRE